MFSEFCYYLFQIHVGKEGDKNKFLSSLLGLSLFQMFNIEALVAFLNYVFEPKIPRHYALYFGIILWVSITTINYFLLYRKRIEIIKRIEGFSSKRETIGQIIFVVYILATLFFMFYAINNFAVIKNPTYDKGVIIGYSKGYHNEEGVVYRFYVNGTIYEESNTYYPKYQKIEIGDSCFVVYAKNNPYNSHLIEIYDKNKPYIKLKNLHFETEKIIIKVDSSIYKQLPNFHYKNYKDSVVKN